MSDGPALFARFAYPPNALGYCGPSDVTLVQELVTAGEAGQELRHAITAFAGAWPYLELIASRTGRDPLDRAVVEAYWLGGALIDGVDTLDWGNSVDDRFRARAGFDWEQISTALNAGGLPTHAFHVFCIYPWVGLLHGGAVEQSMNVLQQCRIRWGRVVGKSNGTLLVDSEPLVWDGRQLVLGPTATESVEAPLDSALAVIETGDLVAMHWNYVCQAITEGQARALRMSQARHLAIANAGGLSADA